MEYYEGRMEEKSDDDSKKESRVIRLTRNSSKYMDAMLEKLQIKLHNQMIRKYNKTIRELAENSRKYGYDVYKLTRLEGNCLFESLIHLGYGTTVKKFRNMLSYMVYQYGNYPGFFPNQPGVTLKTMFYEKREDSLVYDIEKKKIIEYDYDTMCTDITCNYSWELLPTQLLLMVISRIYNIRILVFSSENDNITDASYNPDAKYDKKVAIGQLDYSHYVPLIKRSAKKMRKPILVYPSITG